MTTGHRIGDSCVCLRLCAVLCCAARRFEKLFSGLYLGEVVRALLAALVERGLLLAGVDLPAGADGRREPPPGLAKPFAFETRNVSRLELVSIACAALSTHTTDYTFT